MLLELFTWLAQINPYFNVFAYITLRGILGLPKTLKEINPPATKADELIKFATE